MAYNSKYTGQEVEELLDSIDNKQDKLIAGEGIDITNNVISATIDNELFKVVDALPDEPDDEDKDKIFIIRDPESASDSNQFIEYIWIGSWEEFGRFQAEIDFEGYYTKEEIDAMMLNYETKEELEETLEDYLKTLNFYSESLGSLSGGDGINTNSCVNIGRLSSTSYVEKINLYTALCSGNTYSNLSQISMGTSSISLNASSISLSLGSNNSSLNLSSGETSLICNNSSLNLSSGETSLICSSSSINLSSGEIRLVPNSDRKAYYIKNGHNSSEIATLSDLEGYVPTSDLSNYVTETALSSILEEYAKTSDIADTYLEKLIYYRENNNNREVIIGNYSEYITNCNSIAFNTKNGSMKLSSIVNIDASSGINLNANKALYNDNEIATVKDLEGYVLTSDLETVTTEEIDALFE